MKAIFSAVFALLLTAAAIPAAAQINPYKEGTQFAARRLAGADHDHAVDKPVRRPGRKGIDDDLQGGFGRDIIQADKFTRLAEAIPAEKYTWRPASDVRSVAEVFLHVSAANYNLYKLVGTPPPAGFDVKGFEKSTTDKAKIVATLKDSFAHSRKAITAMPDSDLEKSLDWFGGKNTERGILLFIVRHGAEHLGQSIAYARNVGITPPWTEDAQKKQPDKK